MTINTDTAEDNHREDDLNKQNTATEIDCVPADDSDQDITVVEIMQTEQKLKKQILKGDLLVERNIEKTYQCRKILLKMQPSEESDGPKTLI